MEGNYFVRRENCPVCKSAQRQELYSCSFSEPPIRTYLEDFYSPQGGVEFDYLGDTKFIVDECKECGLIYQRDIPNDFLMEKLYEEWISPVKVYNTKVRVRGIEYYAQLAKEIEMCIRYFRTIPGELKFFDFGMGWGEWCLVAKAYGCSVSGAELSKARIKHARAAGISVITWEDIPKHQFDFIHTGQVFEHIANPLETLRYLSQSLKAQGIIKISVPNGWDLQRRLAVMDWTAPKGSRDSLNAIAPFEHINCFTQDSLTRLGHIAGLTPVQLAAQGIGKKKLLDFTLRDVVRPLYRQLISPSKKNQGIGSTHLFFQNKAPLIKS